MLLASNIEFTSDRVACDIQLPSESPFKLYFQCEGSSLSSSSNWVVASLLLPAMTLGLDLHIDGTVSPTLMANMDTIQSIYLSWRPSAKRICVTAAHQGEDLSGNGVGLFFSGGVDSLYSLVKHLDQVTHLILVHGFDVSISDQEAFLPCQNGAIEIASALGKKLCIVRTNLREFSNKYCGWGIYHGGALAAVSAILSPETSKTIIGSSYTYNQLHAWGSHPLLDPLWSTASQQLIHDGAESNRVQKTLTLAENEWTLRHLRVCWEDSSAYNCGKCEKCLRTVVGLKIAGKLESCPVLPHSIDFTLIRHLELTPGSALFWEEFENQVKQPDLAAAIQLALKNYRRGVPPDTGTLHSKARRLKATVRKMLKVATT